MASVPVLDLTADSITLTRVLCDIESVSGDEATIADAIEASLAGLPHLEVIRDGDAIVARTNLGRAQRAVIAGHIDTVPINDNVPTRFETLEPGHPSGQTPGDYLWGRGTVDMKAGVAVQLKLAAELTEPVVDVTWIWYDHEEVSDALNGLGRLARTRPELLVGDFAILGEPSNSSVEGGCNGNLRVEIRTLAAYTAREVEVEGLVYREGLNAVGITGGIAGNIIPDECMVHVNYRFAPNRSGEEAIAHIHELFPGYDIRVVDLAEGARPGMDAELAKHFLAAVGGEAKPKYGWTDVARFAALGMPGVNYGPGDPIKAHADDERVLLDQIVECERGLRAWLTAG
jgi:succinyl-diaminopimelate desuccinylase